jgi:cleavage stimulation factor subunit 2
MFELMKQMKQCIEANPNEAKTLLSTNPQLAYALLQAQVVMRIVDPQVAMALLNRTDKDVIPTPTDVKKSATITTTQPTAAVTAPLPLPVTGNPAAPFPFPGIPGAPFSMPMMAPNNASAQQAAAAALFQAAFLSGAGMFPGSLIPPPMPHATPFPSVQPTFPPPINPLAPPIRTPNLDENAALLLLQLDDAQLAQLPPAQSMQIRSLREQIAKTGLLPKM